MNVDLESETINGANDGERFFGEHGMERGISENIYLIYFEFQPTSFQSLTGVVGDVLIQKHGKEDTSGSSSFCFRWGPIKQVRFGYHLI